MKCIEKQVFEVNKDFFMKQKYSKHNIWCLDSKVKKYLNILSIVRNERQSYTEKNVFSYISEKSYFRKVSDYGKI